MRAWATVVQRDLQVNSIIADVYAGRPVVYSTFLAYDEVAHHSGIERPETLATLRQVDRQIGRIATSLRFAPRPYRLVVLSDHGQSQGATFLDRYGMHARGPRARRGRTPEPCRSTGSRARRSPSSGRRVTELSAGASRRLARPSSGSRSGVREDGEVRLGESEPASAPGEQPPEVVVMASGCLGLDQLPARAGPRDARAMQRRYPRLIPSLREHPGVGFLLVRSEEHGAIAIGARGSNYLDEGRVEGEDPLQPFGPNAARHVRRTDGFPHCPDIVINSTYWRDSDEVAAFEELVGSHGGLGGSQSYPFLLHPAELQLPEEELVGAEAVHRHLRRWLIELGT